MTVMADRQCRPPMNTVFDVAASGARPSRCACARPAVRGAPLALAWARRMGAPWRAHSWEGT